ncbi:RNA polymerase II-associated protein [Schizopora paradoxa]|uniref:RNA polymerase II-associated protein n=1 Tax=Schizopora paradoxa TaxID=27342 RepID=A0A0H2RTA8_9AGAM|nr:RNA polymerase II-associated protein [Schizopora paradoxa]
MADPLLALQDAIRNNTTITYSNAAGPCASLAQATHLVLSPTTTLPKATPTRLRKPGGSTSTDPQANPSDFFGLDAVYLAWSLRDKSVGDYLPLVRENGLVVGFVSVTERKALVDWLEGKLSQHDRIVPSASDSKTPPGSPPQQRSVLSSAPGQSLGAISPTKRRYVVDNQDAEVVKRIKQNEVELSDRNTVLRGAKPNNFSNVRAMFTERLKKLKEASKAGAPPAPAPTPKIGNMFPIIIISSSPTSLITMYNVKRFFQESSFESPADAKARASSEGVTRPEDVVAIYRKRTHIDPSGQERETQDRYFVVDGVEALAKFGNDAWDRVVCVLTTGQAWQFKPYKWTEPRTLFHHVKGFYVSWANDPPNPKIKDWNVTELKIDQNRRHVDKSVLANFWKTLDTWTLANKPWLIKT